MNKTSQALSRQKQTQHIGEGLNNRQHVRMNKAKAPNQLSQQQSPKNTNRRGASYRKRTTFRDNPQYQHQFQSLVASLSYPEALPITEHVSDISQLIQNHQIVIVSGQTGSGKTTQLPKIALDALQAQKRIGRIAHTQPRRLAATSVASRIAEELKTPLGQGVGYQIRFKEMSSKHTCIKLMTDGVLLAQMQKDPYLNAYDCIIIDEAHERSLNIDFLMGFLKKLCQKRRDLKLMITSATIDAKRFSEFFSIRGKSAPVVEVSGRTYPVQIDYMPVCDPEFDERDEQRTGKTDQSDLLSTLVEAVHRCVQEGRGDILVFLPGEREIREAMDALEKESMPHVQLLPLFSRLSHAAQQAIFAPKGVGIRVILSTNVAETSLTVPGIRYVIDTGLARVKRYSIKNKVEQLLIEPISQASANQRAGRCGRLGPGRCIRLYDELDFNRRDEFTDPEIMRSSLASVILRMKSLRIKDIESFDFLDQPTGRAFADGYQLLSELGALDEQQKLTQTGRLLSQLPLDPRIARMILEVRKQHCLQEILIITSALSIQDPRERPFEQQSKADQAHAIFKDDKSSFLSFLKIWDFYQKAYKNRTSQRLFAEDMKRHFLHVGRLREWKNAYEQLLSLVQEQSWGLNQTPATFEQIHKALLSGLLGNLGFKTEEQGQYMGARQIKFYIHPGSSMRKKAGRWIVASEITQTSRLYARTLANVDPRWIEAMGAHLIKKQYNDPQWSQPRGQVVVNERGLLYGLPIYTGRKVNYAKVQPEGARELMIRHALVEGDINSKSLDFIDKNLKLVRSIEVLEHKSRRQDILVDDQLIVDFYLQHIPEEVTDQRSLEAWYKHLDTKDRQTLLLNKEELMRHQAHGVSSQLFPKQWCVYEGFYLR
ncbi:MAG: ATP-dependent RNA helicase HrpA, partial [Alcaligenaceae bacterium]|nr:ATP-dependent RNA helicase HrpA [Alcaligenaceae bacterium]